MRLFKHIDKYEEIQLDLQDDYEHIIQTFQPESIMSEHQNENPIVLEQAIKNTTWSGYALFYPEISTLDIELFEKHIRTHPKIFLLKQNDLNKARFNKYGRVVYDLDEYREEAKKLIYFCTFIDEEEFYSSDESKG